jgi:cytochrome c oxidase subunit 7
MAIAPIQGLLKRKIIVDIGMGVAIGFALGALWWSEHKSMVATRENYYAALAEKKKIEESA